MLCTRPFVRGLAAYGCGQCLPCRINRRRLWSSRMQLEASKHPASSFVTLTYDQEHHPSDGSLRPKDLTLWLKRLRKVRGPFRYFAVGEYGDRTWRPHYHAALFGVNPLEQDQILTTWSMGHCLTLPLTPASCSYVAGYVAKKMTRKADMPRPELVPEFARMSLRPGIGAPSMDDVARVLNSQAGAAAVARLGDVPTTLQCGRTSMPLGRYLSNRLRAAYGQTIAPRDTPAAKARTLQMLELQQAVGRAAFRFCFPMVDWQRSHQMVTRHNIHSQRTL